ncbi:hypothetical protein B1992_05250 [Pseudoxanthomonas broegbernensis]|uniref:Uncharacterized protein n=1 Tax=Pseudoxanthomonas broegbernensis TaxID=83619 RepID=A0A7V8GP30_9GAMM|nr:hypothetical protein [Pseudoxanthomonas broegbernensis]KAF1687379.1 hypothetical protein B1992_05250 [Pseudoxanthomonas broegbernensis]MBB6065615.1 hypothetical protein [Pseudoxanthomonas broegbernensis]
MNTIILLYDSQGWERAQWPDAPLVTDWNGRSVSLRAGPRTPLPQDGRDWPPVAVYAPDELSEEEFQSLYEAHRPGIVELGLHY